MQHHLEMTPKGAAYAAAHNLRPGGCPAGIDPQEWRKAIGQRVNQHLSLVTVLLSLLDGVAPDPDLEPDADDEPFIGGNVMDFDSVDCELDDADNEPSLGAPEPGYSPPPYGLWRGQLPYLAAMPLDGQGAWARGRGDDDEQVNEDGDELDTRESDELHDGEVDEGEQDGNQLIAGGGYHL